MILILSDYTDRHVEQVALWLERAGALYFWYDPAEFPAHSQVRLRHTPTGERSFLIESRHGTINLDSVHVVWTRRPGKPSCPSAIQDDGVRRYVESECDNLMKDLWESLDAVWFPAPRPHIQRMQRKNMQLKLAADIGFRIPETLITNDPEAFLDFYEAFGHGGEHGIISKILSPSFQRTLGATYVRYTEPVGPTDVTAKNSLKVGPAIFQRYVPKDREIRVTVVGSEVFAAAIESQKTRRTQCDWRRYDHGHTPHAPHKLPPDVASMCRQLVHNMQLLFGTIDLVLTPEGDYVFLEINPNGQYLWLENLTGLPISRAVAQQLLQLSGDPQTLHSAP